MSDFIRRFHRLICGGLFSGILGVLSFMMISGCGYTTRSTLPKNIKTIHIASFKNKIDYTSDAGGGRNIYLPLLEVDVRNAVIDRFLFDGNLKVVEEGRADFILRGNLKRYERTVLRYTDDDDVQEYRVHVTVSLELWTPQTDEPDWTESDFVGEATYFVSGPQAISEETAIKNAITDLARRIVERTIENW